jgi:hypothetical protein
MKNTIQNAFAAMCFLSIVMAAPILAETENKPTDQDFYISIDNGFGIAPRNFLGFGLGWVLQPNLEVEAGVATGSRSNVLGPAYNLGVRFGERFYAVTSVTIYHGQGRVPISFSKRYYQVDTYSDRTIDYCNSHECDSNKISGERSAKWDILYGSFGLGTTWGGGRLKWFSDLGYSGVLSYYLDVEKMANDGNYGDVTGIVVDRGYWLQDSIVSRSDSGPFIRFGAKLMM